MRAIRNKLAIRSRVVRSLSVYRQGAAPNIALFAMRRGGSTLLAEMLGSERGMRVVDEPFFVLECCPDYALKRKWLPEPMHSLFFDLEGEDRERVRAFMAELLAGRLPIGNCRNPKFPFVADRMLLKILHATSLVDWLAGSFELQVVRMLRHPAPQALSVLRAGWAFEAEAYYQKPAFLQGFLDEDQLEFGRRILDGPSRWGKAILDWCITHHLLVHASPVASPLVTYEELMSDPAETCRWLCDRLGLSEFERIVAQVRRPSASPGGCSKDNLSLIESGDSGALIRSWQGRVDADMASEAQEILDRFGVTIYNMVSPLPSIRGAGTAEPRAAAARECIAPSACG